MRNLQITIYKSGDDARPEKIITIPLTALDMGMKLIPRKTRTTLEREGIDLTECTELIKDKDLKGTLIAIESTTEKLLISID
jgi:hypothetical protein